MEPYGILWDLDGVLADSTRLHYESWRATFEKRGYELSFERFTSTFGRNNHAVLTDMFGRPPTAAELQTIADEKEIAFRQSVPGQMDLLPGALDWLKQFQAWGFPQAVASSAPPENIEIQMDELNIRPYFAALVSAAGLPGKPDPAVFLKAAAQLGLPPQRCLVMEDAPAGVQGAKTGGMKCMAVLTTNSPASLQGADLIVNRLSDLTPSQVRALLALDAPAEAEDPAFCPIVRRSRPARSH